MSSDNIDDILAGYMEGNDFGFTTSETSKADDSNIETIGQYKEKISKIKELIMPLLANLHGTAKDDYIYWPNRKEQLEKKIKEFLDLTA